MNKDSWIAKNLLTLILLGIVAFLVFRDGCRTPAPKEGIKSSDTTRQVVYIQQPPQVIPQYIPVASSSQPPIVLQPQYSQSTSSNDLKEVKRLLEEIATKHYSTTTYPDTIKLKDSSGNNVGTVNLLDKISENELKSRNVNYSLKFPKEIITVTNTLYPKPVNQLYLGGGLSGSKTSLLSGAELGALLKTKKDNVYGLSGGIYMQTLQPYIKAQYYFKIKLRK